MEQNTVLPKRWNGPSEWEHLNTQCQAWNHAKQNDRDDKIAHHDEFTAELQILSSQQAELIKLDKSLHTQIQILRVNQNVNWKKEIKAVQQQVEVEKEKRRGYKSQRQVINKCIQELKDNGLSGARLCGRCRALSVESNTVEKDLFKGPRESVSTIPPADVHLYEHDTNIQSTSLPVVESFTAMLNSQEDDCGNESMYLPVIQEPAPVFNMSDSTDAPQAAGEWIDTDPSAIEASQGGSFIALHAKLHSPI
jgi:hypothetical protein